MSRLLDRPLRPDLSTSPGGVAALLLAAAVAIAPATAAQPAPPPGPQPTGPQPTAPAAAEASPVLDRYEERLRRAPDDLFLGADYRQEAIAREAYDRAIAFFQDLVAAHPESAAAVMNLGYAYVDKIPAAGAITQVILANTALGHFSTALELEDTWLGRYTRGNSYLFWPAIFGRAPDGIADLERALALAEAEPQRPYHARAWAALGDGHWRLSDVATARDVWRRGLARFPDDEGLRERLEAVEDGTLDAYLEAHFAAGERVATHLREMREEAVATWRTP